MAKKPADPNIVTVHTYWESSHGLECPLCNKKLEHAFNDGGRILVTLKGRLWVVTNYYRCLNPDCKLHDAFPMVHESMIQNRKFGKDVWERVIRYHFKTHLDYRQIKEILWDDCDVSISHSAIRGICNYFENAGVAYLDEQILKEIQTNGEMIVSLDGAQPKKGRPALWIFTDRISGHTIHAELLDSATADILSEILKKLQERFSVPIKAIISDKQQNIVNAVKLFNLDVPHAFCQYHFLNHIMEPIEAKDSHIATQIRSAVRKISIIPNLTRGQLDPKNPNYKEHYSTFKPLAEELLNAISVKGPKWSVFPGKEIFLNINYIYHQLLPIQAISMNKRCRKSLNSVISQLETIISDYQELYNDVLTLLEDTDDLRHILSSTTCKSKEIKRKVKTWVYRLQTRLKRRNLEYYPVNLKYLKCKYGTPLEEIWQQWIRLENSYHDGIYLSYDDTQIEKTNNATEQLINRTKRHFKKWLGQQDIQTVFEHHGDVYSKLIELDYSHTEINEILWEQSKVIVENGTSRFECFRPVLKRDWHIRTNPTKNLLQLEQNLQISEKK